MPRDVDETLRETRIRELSLPEALKVPAGSSVRATIDKMRAGRHSCALICAGEKVIGLFTERDLLNRVSTGEVALDSSVDDVMTPNPKTLGPEDSVGEALAMMTKERYRHVPLVDGEGRAVGLLTAREILVYIADHYPAEVVNLPPDLHQTPKRAEGG